MMESQGGSGHLGLYLYLLATTSDEIGLTHVSSCCSGEHLSVSSTDATWVLPEKVLPRVCAARCIPLTTSPADAVTRDAEGIGIHGLQSRREGKFVLSEVNL